jgi:hypothetical protein
MKKSMKLVLVDSQGNPTKTVTVSGEGPDIDERFARVMEKIQDIQDKRGWTQADLDSFARKMKQ